MIKYANTTSIDWFIRQNNFLPSDSWCMRVKYIEFRNTESIAENSRMSVRFRLNIKQTDRFMEDSALSFRPIIIYLNTQQQKLSGKEKSEFAAQHPLSSVLEQRKKNGHTRTLRTRTMRIIVRCRMPSTIIFWNAFSSEKNVPLFHFFFAPLFFYFYWQERWRF